VKAIESGWTANMWLNEVEEVFNLAGIKDTDYMRLIFHYNHNRRHCALRWEQMQRTKKFRPYVQFITVAHGAPLEKQVTEFRVRPKHAALDGIIRHIDDPIWPKIQPPIDPWCRCMLVSINAEEIERGDFEVTSDAKLKSLAIPRRSGLPDPPKTGFK
jgi:hypothetical protein